MRDGDHFSVAARSSGWTLLSTSSTLAWQSFRSLSSPPRHSAHFLDAGVSSQCTLKRTQARSSAKLNLVDILKRHKSMEGGREGGREEGGREEGVERGERRRDDVTLSLKHKESLTL